MTDWAAIGRKVADAAPLLGTALGGPAGAALGALVASTLGTAGSPAEVMKKLQTDPAAFIRVQELEQQERESLRGYVLEMAKAEMQDQQQAREVHKDHWMPALLTLILAAMVSGMTWGLFVFAIPTDAKDVIFFIVGQVFTAFLTAVAFWLGSSKSSNEKNKMLLDQTVR